MAKKKKQPVIEVIQEQPKTCFTCGKSFPLTDKQRIETYKNIYLKTGINYVYFKNANGQISITKSKGFKPNKGQEYALVSEFGNIPDSNMVEVTNE